MREIWKTINGYDGKYEVSNRGKVRIAQYVDSHGKMQGGKIISSKYNNRGYEQVHLNINGIKDMKLVHRLVAEAFISNHKDLPQVNHINQNKKDNGVENLEWCTNLYNRHYGDSIKLMVKNRDYKEAMNNRRRKIVQCELSGKRIKLWDSISIAHRATGVNDTSISFCCRGKQKTAGGYLWEYAL